jgi:hypothetical protein
MWLECHSSPHFGPQRQTTGQTGQHARYGLAQVLVRHENVWTCSSETASTAIPSGVETNW